MSSSQNPGIACANCPLRGQPYFRPLTSEELGFVETMRSGQRRFAAHEEILAEGEASERFYTMMSGWAFRYLALPDGRRQILNFLLPGDIIGLQAKIYDCIAHSVEALTEVVLCAFPQERLFDLFRVHPDLGYGVTWSTVNEAGIGDQHLASVGRRSARGRLAYLFAELYTRLEHRHQVQDGVCRLPLTQEHLADALGLSAVHVNRTLRRLRAAGIVEFSNSLLRVLDIDALCRAAGFAPPQASAPRALL